MKRILLTAISIGTILFLLFLITGHSAPRDLDERLKEMRTSSKPLMLWVYE